MLQSFVIGKKCFFKQILNYLFRHIKKKKHYTNVKFFQKQNSICKLKNETQLGMVIERDGLPHPNPAAFI